MIYVFENPENNASIVYDESTLTQEEKARGIAIEVLPPSNPPAGKQAVLKTRKSTNEIWWEYVDLQPNSLTLESNISELQSQNAQMLLALVQGGLM